MSSANNNMNNSKALTINHIPRLPLLVACNAVSFMNRLKRTGLHTSTCFSVAIQFTYSVILSSDLTRVFTLLYLLLTHQNDFPLKPLFNKVGHNNFVLIESNVFSKLVKAT